MAGLFGDTAPSGITMNVPSYPLELNARLAPVFTLGSALRWLGHDCSQCLGCGPIDGLAASVWFIRRGSQFLPSLLEPLVVVDLTETGEFLTPIAQIIREVNCCTCSDGIQVYARLSHESRCGATALRRSALPSQPEPSSAGAAQQLTACRSTL
ncbi:MAG: hypothetical protein ABI253_06015 [Mycobacterium sp.]